MTGQHFFRRRETMDQRRLLVRQLAAVESRHAKICPDGAARFAKANGWKICNCFSLDKLEHNRRHRSRGVRFNPEYYEDYVRPSCLDHPEYYCTSDSRRLPVAIMAHDYDGADEQLRKFIHGIAGLVIHEPAAGKAASWYYPGATLPMCITRPDAQTIVWPTPEEMAATMAAEKQAQSEMNNLRRQIEEADKQLKEMQATVLHLPTAKTGR